jgi:hypothetical protein
MSTEKDDRDAKLAKIAKSLPSMTTSEQCEFACYLLVVAVSMERDTVTEAMDLLRFGYPRIEKLLRTTFGQVQDAKLRVRKALKDTGIDERR